jgi:hypothetical protein
MGDNEHQQELSRMARKRGWIHAAVVALVVITLAPLLFAFIQTFVCKVILWPGQSPAFVGVIIGFAIVVMAAVTICCILLLRMREYPPDEDHPAPSLIAGVVVLAIGALVVAVSVLRG